MAAALAAAGSFFVATRNNVQDEILRVETQQGVRSAMDTMVRDLRLGGACLPVSGDFVTLDSVNSTSDQIATRTGLVRPNQTCIRTTTTADISATTSTIAVETANGFTSGMRVYIRKADGTTGEIFTLTGVNVGAKTLTKATTLSQSYLLGSGVYAVDERQYAVDSSVPAQPVLTIAANGGSATPFAAGIENLTVKYQLARNCDSASGCDVVDIPANDAEFAIVNQLYITLTARSRTTLTNGQYYRITKTVSAKPRNLLPG